MLWIRLITLVQLTMVVSFRIISKKTTRSQLLMAKEPLILEGIPGLLERKSRPGHVGIPRARMDLPFAVLLMRKSYEVAGKYLPPTHFHATVI